MREKMRFLSVLHDSFGLRYFRYVFNADILLTYSEGVHHSGECQEFPLACKYCGESFTRNSIAKHEEDDCNYTPLVCPYSCVNCLETVLRMNLSQHLVDLAQKHLEMTLQFTSMLMEMPASVIRILHLVSAAAKMNTMQSEVAEISTQLQKEKSMLIFCSVDSFLERVDEMQSTIDATDVVLQKNKFVLPLSPVYSKLNCPTHLSMSSLPHFSCYLSCSSTLICSF
jgi:hypothetical protein